MDSKKTIQMNLFTKQKQTHRHRSKLTVTTGDTQRRETLGVWEEHTHSTTKLGKELEGGMPNAGRWLL